MKVCSYCNVDGRVQAQDPASLNFIKAEIEGVECRRRGKGGWQIFKESTCEAASPPEGRCADD